MPAWQSDMFRCLSSAAVAIVLGSALGLVGRSPALGNPPYTMEERAQAIASPSMVYLESWVSGYLRRKDTGEALRDKPFVLTYRCSGFVVSGQGYVVSSAHCIQPDKRWYKDSAASLLAAERIKAGLLPAEQKDAFIKETVAATEFTGENLVSAHTSKIYGQLFQGQGSLTAEPAWLAESIQVQPSGQGDVALIKFAVTGLPVAEISPEPLTPNAPIIALGFATDSTSGTATYTVRSSPEKILGKYGSQIPTLYEMDKDLGPVARGGIIADSSGRVVGLLNADPAAKDRVNRVVTNIDSVRAALGGATAENSLGPIDRAYRAGLDAYFGGRYSEANQKLDTVIAAMPNHSVAIRYRSQSADRLRIEGEAGQSGASWVIWLVAILGAALLACAIAILWLLVQQRKRQREAVALYGPISAMPVSAYPISAVPVSGGAYDYLTAPVPQQLEPGTTEQQQQLPPIYGLSGLAGQHSEREPAAQEGQGESPWAPPPPPQQR